jgi:hypothetical protein
MGSCSSKKSGAVDPKTVDVEEEYKGPVYDQLVYLPDGIWHSSFGFLSPEDNISCAMVSKSWNQLVKKNPEMTRLNLSHMWRDLTDDTLFEILKNFPFLVVLNVNGCSRLSDSALETVAKCCPKLEICNFSRCRALTDDGLQHLAKCRRLRTLIVWGCVNLTHDGCERLTKKLPHLFPPIL